MAPHCDLCASTGPSRIVGPWSSALGPSAGKRDLSPQDLTNLQAFGACKHDSLIAATRPTTTPNTQNQQPSVDRTHRMRAIDATTREVNP
jgi:hypothetical protein